MSYVLVASAVARAIREGVLVRPDACSSCGARGRIHGHHDDYAKPLDVRWLCASCHGQWHAANGHAAGWDGPLPVEPREPRETFGTCMFVKLPAADEDALRARAKEAERSLVVEIRRAVRLYLAGPA
jgi:ribosomal protein S27AE